MPRVAMAVGKPSLTARLTGWYTLTSVGIVLTATVYLYWSFVQAFDYRDAKRMTAKIEVVRALLALDDDGAALRSRIEKEWAALTTELFYIRILNERGEIIAKTPGSYSLFQGLGHTHAAPGSTQDPADLKLISLNEQVFRYLSVPLQENGRKYMAQVALDRTEENLLLNEYRQRLFIVLALSIVGCALVCFHLARRGLRPLREMARTADSITSFNLDGRMLPLELPAELAHLARTFNAMLDRLKASFDRLQQFSADLAHELRTPVNNISGELQVALGKDRTCDYYKDALGSSLEECHRISRIIDSLLFLAHAENPRFQLSKEPVNLRKELAAVLEFYEPVAAEGGLTCSLSVDGEISVNVERTLFQRAIGNILSNAIKRTPPDGRIQIRAHRARAGVEIEVEDTGIGIPPEHIPHVFDRFYRVDASRSKDSGGSGLGLAIVKSIASIHGGDVSIRSEVEAGTRVRVTLPLIPSKTSHGEITIL